MKYNPDIHRRRSIRLKEYDYSQNGAYFMTICTWNRECLFGNILDGEIVLNDVGKMVQWIWDDLTNRFPIMELDEYVIMPNHLHGIIVMDCNRRGESCIRPENDMHRGESCIRPCVQADHKEGDHKDRPYGTTKNSIGRIIQAFKSITTHQYTIGVKQQGWPPYAGRIWQRNYYDHVMRNEDELNRIREYIINNPLKWTEDENNPANIKMNSSCRGEVSLP